MSNIVRGKLVWQGTGDKRVRRIVYPTKKGMSIPTPFDADQLSAALRNAAEEEVEVDLEVENGKPKRIRPVGAAWQAAPPPPTRSTGRPQERRDTPARVMPSLPGEFHNPYNFVPAPPLPVEKDGEQFDLGHHEPIGHDRYHIDRYSGTIKVKLTTITPLLLPDAAAATEDAHGHKTLPIRIGKDGRPILAVTSVKGMLRAAYEAITNSRFAVFPDSHADRLALRMPASEGLRVVPARVVGSGQEARIELMTGASSLQDDGRRPDGPMYAAWLQAYPPPGKKWGSFFEHGRCVWAFLTPWQHQRFDFWNVAELRDGNGPEPTDIPADQRRPWRNASPASSPPGFWTRGYVCITRHNFDRKHDERVFFCDGPPRYGPFPLTAEHKAQWRELIRNYQELHQSEIARGQKRPSALNNDRCVWSRHVTGQKAEQELVDGTLCYAKVQPQGNGLSIVGLYPVMISRDLHSCSPRALLPSSLLPATKENELSPADRVFGWAHASGNGAYRGNVRIGPIACATEDAITKFDSTGLPLAILGQPKPQQARFYVAASDKGETQQNVSKTDAGYQDGKGLRGRKVYPHHNLPDGYWNEPLADRMQEYRRPQLNGQEQRDDQNRSILAWVRPGAEFTLDIHVTNLSAVELGALLTLLQLPEKHYHRLGGGKPLGFGSVRVDVASADLRTGEQWKAWYSSLVEPEALKADLASLMDQFKTALGKCYQKPYQEVSFIRAFLRGAAGFTDGLPIHYPRARRPGTTGPLPPHADGKAYEWFVANDREGRDAGPHVSLPNLADDKGLPILEGDGR